jgi:hypothetical protein
MKDENHWCWSGEAANTWRQCIMHSNVTSYIAQAPATYNPRIQASNEAVETRLHFKMRLPRFRDAPSWIWLSS